MHRPQEQVRELHRDVIGAPTSPSVPMLRNPMLRARLIIEEAIETAYALIGARSAYNLVQKQLQEAAQKAAKSDGKPNIIEAIDGLCDTIVVCYGTAEDIGIDLEPFFDAVHASNMAKKDGPMDAGGKKLKPVGWAPPDLGRVLAEQQRSKRVD